MPTQIALKKQLSTVELSILYDRIYNIADRLIKKHNPCDIHIENGKTVCNDKHNDSMLCCYGCNVWNKGCTTKCLGCKLFLCHNTTNEVLKERFYRLKQLTRKFNLPTQCYLTKEGWLKLMENKLCNTIIQG